MTIFDPFIFLARAHQVNFLELCSRKNFWLFGSDNCPRKNTRISFAAYGGFCLLIKSIYFFLLRIGIKINVSQREKKANEPGEKISETEINKTIKRYTTAGLGIDPGYISET